MAQVNETRSGVTRLTLRTIALIIGLVGTALALVIDILYSLFHVLGRIAGFTADTGHFFYGLLVVLGGLAGSLMAPLAPIPAAVLLAAAGIGFFFVVGWWAIITIPFFIVAALLTFSNRKVRVPTE